MDRRLGFTIVAALVLVGAGIGGYFWYGRGDNTGSAQSTLDQVNRKLALQGQPTLPPGADLNRPRSSFAETTAPTVTPGPSPTPRPSDCGGGAIAGGQEIADKFGEVRGCDLYGTQLVFTTAGGSSGGGIGTFQCEADDESCLRKGPPRRSGSWSFYSAPHPGAVKILTFVQPDILIVNDGGAQLCFNLTSHVYDERGHCATSARP